jgi:hypothetical protein
MHEVCIERSKKSRDTSVGSAELDALQADALRIGYPDLCRGVNSLDERFWNGHGRFQGQSERVPLPLIRSGCIHSDRC